MLSWLLLLAALASVFAAPTAATAQEVSSFKASVDKEAYSEGESIVIWGSVGTVIPDTSITIQIIHDNENIIHVHQVPPADDGSFAHIAQASGPRWDTDGRYTVRVSYGADNVREVGLNFAAKGAVQDEQVAEVRRPDSTSTLDIRYTIGGGTLVGMDIEDTTLSLVAEVDSSDQGVLTVTLPKDAIDARTNGCQGGDDTFITSIDGVQVPYEEVGTTGSDRTIAVGFQEGDRNIRIIGTCVIPEFGVVATAVLAAAVAAAVAASGRMPRLAA